MSLAKSISRVLAGCGVLLLASAACPAVPLELAGKFLETSQVVTKNPPLVTACTSTSTCYLMFSTVPTGKQIVINQLSCRISVNAGDVTDVKILAQRLLNVLPSLQHVTALKTAPGIFIVNASTLMLFAAGERPLISIRTSAPTTIGGDCTISGEKTSSSG